MQCFKDSTKNTDNIFNQICLCSRYVRELRSVIKEAFDKFMSEVHTTADSSLNIFLIARNLFVDNLAEPRKPADLPISGKSFDSFVILRDGSETFVINVDNFNSIYVWEKDTQPLIPVTQADNFIDIDLLLDVIGEGQDWNRDPAKEPVKHDTLDLTES